MPDYTRNEIIDIKRILGESRGKYHAAERLIRVRFPNRDHHPSDRTIRRIELRERQGPPRRRQRRRFMVIERNDPRVLVVLAMIHLNPQISTRSISLQSGISRETVRRILRLHRFHPYHITLHQELTENDFRRRLDFCRWAREMIQNDPYFFRFVMFSDEANFQNTGELNRHNSHYWSINNPHWRREIDHQNRWSVTVWCGILNGHLIGPYFFDRNVNTNSYLNFLRFILPDLLADVDLQTRARMWFQHDGAPVHRSLIVQEFLNQRYPNRWIGIGRGNNHIEWAPRSPDLTSPDFFLWGYLKNVVYADAPTTRENMMQRITNACQNIPQHVLLSTIRSFEHRIRLCIANNGGVFEHLIR